MMRRARGFTLIEVLVAVGLLAFGMTLAIAALRSLTQASSHAEVTTQRAEHLRAVQGFLRTQLSTALPMAFVNDPDSGEARVLIGQADKIMFVSGMPGYLARGGAYLQTLSLVSARDGKQLLYEFQQMSSDGPLPAERPAKVLLDGIADASFDYRTLDFQGHAGPWQAQWDQSGALPPMLRLRLRFIDAHKSWPDFVVAVRLGAVSAVAPDHPAVPVNDGASP